MYFLTTELDLIYYPENTFSQSKRFDFTQKQFIPLATPFSPNGQMIISNEGMMAATTYLMSAKASQIAEDEMTWVETFQKLLNSDTSILRDKSLCYNYFNLSLQILGFDKSFVKLYLQNYALQEPTDEDLLLKKRVKYHKKLLEFLKKKSYFYLEDIQKETKQEMRAICSVLEQKATLNYHFNYLEHGKPIIMDMLDYSRIPKILKFHFTPSYWCKNRLDTNSLTNYILEEMEQFISETIQKNAPYYQIETAFAQNIQREILGTIKMYLTMALKFDATYLT